MNMRPGSRGIFPVRHAFVVQLHTDADVGAGHIVGRVEHVVSRQATSFCSLDTLLAFIADRLREVREEAAGQKP